MTWWWYNELNDNKSIIRTSLLNGNLLLLVSMTAWQHERTDKLIGAGCCITHCILLSATIIIIIIIMVPVVYQDCCNSHILYLVRYSRSRQQLQQLDNYKTNESRLKYDDKYNRVTLILCVIHSFACLCPWLINEYFYTYHIITIIIITYESACVHNILY